MEELMRETILLGSSTVCESVLNMATARVMTKEAGIPFPDTSPIQK